MKEKITAVAMLLPLMFLGNTASAQDEMSCDDIDFSYEVTSRYPDAKDACLGVVERDGERFAKMTVELVRTGTNSATFRFKHADGSYGPTQKTDLDPSWRAEIGGRSYRIRELDRGQELNVYLPSDRWEVALEPVNAVFVTYVGYPLQDDDAGSLPATAGAMPALAAMGGAAIFTAFLMGVYRRRTS